VIRDQSPAKATELSNALNISPLISRLLVARGLDTPEKAWDFLNKSSEKLHDPFLMKDMDKACETVIYHIRSKSKILIYGDYDVDGVTSTVILHQYLRSLGADVSSHIPERLSEGYGLNENSIRGFAREGIRLIITVDSGITAINEAETAKEVGIDLVITDHHTCREMLPDAKAVVNPKRKDSEYPFRQLAGVGVVFKFLCALDARYFNIETSIASKKILNLFSEPAAIGTIADVMPITDENRIIVSHGLEMMEDTKNIGLEALLDEIGAETRKPIGKKAPGKRISSSQVGFIIAPRINACGRISSAMRAVELLTTDDKNTARCIAAELCAVNKQRQLLENEILNEALEYVEKNHDFSKDLFIVAESETWHHGVIGIVASRICEKYHMPCILVSFAGEKEEGVSSDEHIGKGSGRSIKGLNLVEALSSASDCLVKYGGHDLAAGLSVKRKDLGKLRERLNEYARSNLTDMNMAETLNIDGVLATNDINIKSASEISMLEPFGLGNPVPLFCAYEMRITDINAIGEGKHTRMVLERDGMSVTALYFGISPYVLPYFVGSTVDIVCNMDINVFQNARSLQLIIRDMRPSRQYRELITRKASQYKALRAGLKLQGSVDIIPERDDFKAVYLCLKKKINEKHLFTSEMEAYEKDDPLFPIDIPAFASDIYQKTKIRIGLLKLLVILDVFGETGIINREYSAADPMLQRISVASLLTQNKINLESSELLLQLKRTYSDGN